MPHDPILVIGATGKTGRRVARALSERGVPVRPGTRRAPVPFDWEDAATWAPALAGVSAAYVVHPDMALPEAATQIGALCDAAKAAGVGHLVLLTGRGESLAQRCEEIVRISGIGHTILRSAWFAQNFSEGYLCDPVLEGCIALPAGDVEEPFVDLDDVAEVAAAALSEPDRHAGRTYEITGPRLLHFSEVAKALAAATGRPIRYEPISFEAFNEAMADIAGREVADIYTMVFRETLDGRNAWLGDGVVRALGRPPRDFAGFCARAAREGAWQAAA